jgi:hypothetical protein
VSSGTGSDVLRVENTSELIRDVARFAHRVRMALSFENCTGMEVIVHDRSSQLCALVEQSAFVLLGLQQELDCIGDPQVSLIASRISDNADLYRIEGFRIQVKVGSIKEALVRISKWVSEGGIDACGNVAIGEESGSIVVRIDTIK